MPRRCTVCTHDQREAIDQALTSQAPYRDIARRYGVSKDALWRHHDDHLPAVLRRAQEHQEDRHALDIVQQLRAINAASLEVLAAARRTGDREYVLKAVDRVQKQIELQAKLLGEISDQPQVNIIVTPEWYALRSVLLAALTPYPEARVAVAERLLALEAGDGNHA